MFEIVCFIPDSNFVILNIRNKIGPTCLFTRVATGEKKIKSFKFTYKKMK